MTDVRRLFSTPIALEMVDGAVDLEALGKAVAAEKARNPKGLVKSNIGGWHSAATMQQWGGDAARVLASKAAALADGLTIDASAPDAKVHRWQVEMWANISTRGNANQHHFHPGSVWSAVTYLDDGYDGSHDPGLGGELQFLDPRMPMVRMTSPSLRLRDEDGTEQLVEPAIRPKTGLMVLFPAWLAHAVRPFFGEGHRVSVAINLMARHSELIVR